MDKRNAQNLQVGDYIELKHNLGKGRVVQVVEEWTPGVPGLFKDGRYPMVRYEEKGLPGTYLWCTYLIIQTVKPKLRSVT